MNLKFFFIVWTMNFKFFTLSLVIGIFSENKYSIAKALTTDSIEIIIGFE